MIQRLLLLFFFGFSLFWSVHRIYSCKMAWCNKREQPNPHQYYCAMPWKCVIYSRALCVCAILVIVYNSDDSIHRAVATSQNLLCQNIHTKSNTTRQWFCRKSSMTFMKNTKHGGEWKNERGLSVTANWLKLIVCCCFFVLFLLFIVSLVLAACVRWLYHQSGSICVIRLVIQNASQRRSLSFRSLSLSFLLSLSVSSSFSPPALLSEPLFLPLPQQLASPSSTHMHIESHQQNRLNDLKTKKRNYQKSNFAVFYRTGVYVYGYPCAHCYKIPISEMAFTSANTRFCVICIRECVSVTVLFFYSSVQFQPAVHDTPAAGTAACCCCSWS